MSSDQILENPTNRVVAVIDDSQQATEARQALLTAGLTDEQIRVWQGPEAAAEVDTTAKWFADTDEEIKKYRRALEDGSFVLSMPVNDETTREQIHAILKQHEARLITHFGDWVTERMR